MKEKIGQVTLNYSCYKGEDCYSEGAVEDRLLELARTVPKAELNRVIFEEKSWPVLYHFSHIRGNIAEPLPICGQDDVLEIGAGCGAVTGALAKKAKSVTCIELSKKRSLINAYQNQDCGNVEILVGNFQDVEKTLTKQFDYITLIGVYEYAASYIHSDQPFAELLKLVKPHLKPDGRLVVAIENKYGLKYFAGCREDHLNRYFAGIEGYADQSTVRTFSRKRLKADAKQAGFGNCYFYYPYPDYKFPLSIYSEDYLPKMGELSNNQRNFDGDRLRLFDETKAFDNLIADGMFEDFANSFLAVFSGQEKEEPQKRVFTKCSNDRSPRFRIRTDIVEQNGGGLVVTKRALSGGTGADAGAGIPEQAGGPGADAGAGKPDLVVTKRALGGEARAHLANMRMCCEALQEQFAGTCIEINRILNTGEAAQADDVLYLEYVDGVTLDERLVSLLDSRKWEEVAALVETYVQAVSAADNGVLYDVDLIFKNLICKDGRFVAVDYEWTFEKTNGTGGFTDGLCKEFLFFRAVFYFIMDNRIGADLARDLWELAGLTPPQRARFFKMERQFQQYVKGEYVPLGDLYPLIAGPCYDAVGEWERLCREKQVEVWEMQTGAENRPNTPADITRHGESCVVKGETKADADGLILVPTHSCCIVHLRKFEVNGTDYRERLRCNATRVGADVYLFSVKAPLFQLDMEMAAHSGYVVEMSVHGEGAETSDAFSRLCYQLESQKSFRKGIKKILGKVQGN